MRLRTLFTLATFLINIQATLAQIKVHAVGDVMLGSVTPKTILPPYNGEEFVKAVADYLIDADVVFGNLEGSLISDDLKPQKCREESRKAGRCYEFGMPEKLAGSLQKLGFSILSMDNNHSEDYGLEGYEFTQQKLTEFGIKFAPKQGYAALEVKEKQIAVVAFGYSGNSYNISNLIQAEEIISILKIEFDIIYVSFHGGAEGRNALNIKNETEFFLGENRGNVIEFAHTVIDAGADLVIGHGPHVLRAMEIYKNKLIAYSMGNFLTYGNMNISGVTGVTAILKAELDENTGDFLRGKIVPVRQVDRGIPIYDESFEAVDLIKDLTTNDFPDYGIIFTETGSIYNSEIIPPKSKPTEDLTYIRILNKSLNEIEWNKIFPSRGALYELEGVEPIKKPGIE
ncbi:MAG: CapA family protein [Ignavibacteria bacterium]|nr:CapA family protein [Ignavibacteria bacterium]MBT8383215.1 CapA family protein [Ignavibacteria bacterium]MBT8392172.1 CapA family protein [Ignavibacteria bacterium]NNJ53832.1 CapA family protein [Ignavibacteriaceae bacterium]NNL20517.1 CapA family protein [Ignavibacteriaceae bacterium]